MSPSNRYPCELLAEAARSCHDMDEVIAFLGTRPYGNLKRYLMERLTHYGIDVSHFPRNRRYRRGSPRPSTGELREAVAAAVSLTDTLRRLGRPDNTSQRTLLKAWIADGGLDTTHFLGQGHRRGKPGTTARQAQDVLVKHDRERRTRTVHLRRALQEVGVADECAECGTGPEWFGRPMTLEIDHINGDWRDDRRENLRLLCPNCHATTRTWCRGTTRR
ncbi:HNH endonuclease signature motif containing protein [Streptomyces sp. NPDC019396]|uniref:HNH endonuclease signature motif containing protein n=1 Tax=Streptomyces sp. NPDC019396 TaxID=3154687 RepID=UPI003408C224